MKRSLTRGAFAAAGGTFLVFFACYLAYAYSSGITGQTQKASQTAGCGARISGGGGCHGVNPNASIQVAISGPAVLRVGNSGTYTLTVSGETSNRGGCGIAASAGTLSSGSALLQVINQELTHVSSISTPFSVEFTYAPSSPGVVTLFANGKASSGWNWAAPFSVRVGPPPAPSPLLPANGSASVPTSARLVWSGSPGSSWIVELSTTDAFVPLLLHQEVNSDTSYVISEGVLANNTQYFWRVSATDGGGTSAWSPVWSFTTSVTGVEESGSPVPTAFVLEQNYPNPFNPTTVVGSHLPAAHWVKLAVYDLSGREVAVLVNEQRAAGRYQDTFSATSTGGTPLASGVYICRLTAGPSVLSRKMLLIR